jgi:hypothetical protein
VPNLDKAQMVNTITSVVIFGFVLYLKTLINEDIRRLVTKKNCPSLYTIMLQNVPNVTNEELSEWIKERWGESPTDMNWAYSIEELADAYKLKQSESIDANKIRIRLRQNKER